MAILLFILILTFLIVIHELGHFFAALWSKVHVHEFGVGLPPKAITLFRFRGVPFTLNWLPIGGFVRMEGEDGEEENDQKRPEGTYPFYSRSRWQRFVVIVAGPAVNFIFGVIAFIILFAIYGVPEKVVPFPTIASIASESPAEEAGLSAGDELLAAMTAAGSITRFSRSEQFIQYVTSNQGSTITLTVRRETSEKQISVYLRRRDEIADPTKEGPLGVGLQPQYEVMRYPWYQMIPRAIVIGTSRSIEFGIDILGTLRTMVTDLVTAGKVPADVAGPVGIAHQVSKEKIFEQGPLSGLYFAALLSINLAVMNILPIPALDGGRILFLLLEPLFGRKRWTQIEQRANQVGFVLLLTLILLITIKDVIGIFR